MRISYRYLRDVPRFFEDFEFSTDRFDDFTKSFKRINQIRFFGRLAITQQWSLHYTLAYTFEDSLLLAKNGGIEYVSKCRCWAAGFETRPRPHARLSLQSGLPAPGHGQAARLHRPRERRAGGSRLA